MSSDTGDAVVSAPPKGRESAKAREPSRDLSRDIEQAVERQPMDRVRCVRVSGDYYRCNWWCRLGGPHTSPNFDWAGLSTDFIRQSSFLKATMNGATLVIEDANAKKKD